VTCAITEAQLESQLDSFGAEKIRIVGERMRFAVAAYNTGAGNAIRAFGAGDVDAHTAHGDYSADVFERRDAVARYLKRHGLPAREDRQRHARTASTSSRSSRRRAMARSRVGPIEPSGMSACWATRL
jgi:hypothetical protein